MGLGRGEQESMRRTESARAINVESDVIRIDGEAMLYDFVYPVELLDAAYHVVFTSDGAIDIYEAAPRMDADKGGYPGAS